MSKGPIGSGQIVEAAKVELSELGMRGCRAGAWDD